VVDNLRFVFQILLISNHLSLLVNITVLRSPRKFFCLWRNIIWFFPNYRPIPSACVCHRIAVGIGF